MTWFELNLLLDGDFCRKDAWAGIIDLIDAEYELLEKQNTATTMDQHNYELHMVLPKYRDALQLKYSCLTDVAIGLPTYERKEAAPHPKGIAKGGSEITTRSFLLR